MPHKWDPVCRAPKRLVRPVRTDRLGVTGPTPEQAREIARVADGVVVGSALIDALDSGGIEAVADLMRELRSALDEASALSG